MLIKPVGVSSWTALRLLFLLVIQFILFSDYLWRWLAKAINDEDWSYTLMVPLVSLWLAWQKRDQLRAVTPKPSWWGGLFLALGVGGYLVATLWLNNMMLRGYAIVLNIAGLVLLLAGPWLRILWFPIFFLLFAVPWGDLLWDPIALRLQMVVAFLAGKILALAGLDIVVSGATVEVWQGIMPRHYLNVAEACSGLRMVMVFVALGVLLAYLRRRPLLSRLFTVLLALPIGIATNVFRVVFLGVLVLHNMAPEPTSAYHSFLGLLMFVFGMLLYSVLLGLLDYLVPQGLILRKTTK